MQLRIFCDFKSEDLFGEELARKIIFFNSYLVLSVNLPSQWRMQKVFEEVSKISLRSCDVTNQLYGECRGHDHSRMVQS